MKTTFIVLLFWGCLGDARADSFMEVDKNHTAQLVESILSHHFIVELADGSLSDARFSYFKAQDDVYIKKFKRTLRVLSLKMEDLHLQELMGFLYNASIPGIQLEAVDERLSTCRLCEEYSDFEVQAVGRCPYEGLSAIAPCFLVYATVARSLKVRSIPTNRYQPWIDRYSDPEYLRKSELMEVFLNQAAGRATWGQRERMLGAYRVAVEYELKFFENVYKLGL